MLSKFTFVLGGAASGKSDIAEKICVSSNLPRCYIATAQAFDDEMRAKIARHKTARGPDWLTIEAPMNLPAALASVPDGHVTLVDCMTLWLSNQLLAEADLPQVCEAALTALSAASGPIVVVSNEVGQGIVPDTPLGRQFRNAQGRLNRDIAARADCVVGVMAGLPFALKGPLPKALT